MFKAIARWMRAIGYMFSGKVDNVTRGINKDPNVMNAKYDDMIRKMGDSIRQYVNAASIVSSHVAKKEASLLSVRAEIKKIEGLRAGAINIATKVAEELKAKGIDPNTNIEYTQHRSAYNDFSSTLLEKKKIEQELVDAIAAGNETNKNNLATLKTLQRDFDKLKSEKGEMVSRMISSAEERSMNEMISGLSSHNNDVMAERAKMRDMVMESEAAAKITGQVAGTDARRVEEQYLEASVRMAANSEFDALTGAAPVPALTQGSNSSVLDVPAIVRSDNVTVRQGQ